MVAYDSTGAQIASVSFAFTGTPGDNVPDTEMLTGHGIRRIDLIPASGDFVSYDVNFVTELLQVCPPDGDPLMDSTIVRQQTAQLFAQSGAGGPAFQETMYAVYRNADGSLNVIQPPQTGTVCAVNFTLPGLGILDPTLLGLIHVHDVGVGHPSSCPGGETADTRGIANGLSINDLLADLLRHQARKDAGLPDISDDVVDLDKIWRNNPSASASQKGTSVDRVPTNCKWF